MSLYSRQRSDTRGSQAAGAPTVVGLQQVRRWSWLAGAVLLVFVLSFVLVLRMSRNQSPNAPGFVMRALGQESGSHGLMRHPTRGVTVSLRENLPADAPAVVQNITRAIGAINGALNRLGLPPLGASAKKALKKVVTRLARG